MAAFQRTYAVKRCTVWANLPPAHVWHLQRPLVAADAACVSRPVEARR